MDSMMDMFEEDIVVGTLLARHLGLPPDFFTKKASNKSFTKEIKAFKIDTVVMLKISKDFKKYLKDYNAVLLGKKYNQKDFEYVLSLDSKIKIGFWK